MQKSCLSLPKSWQVNYPEEFSGLPSAFSMPPNSLISIAVNSFDYLQTNLVHASVKRVYSSSLCCGTLEAHFPASQSTTQDKWCRACWTGLLIIPPTKKNTKHSNKKYEICHDYRYNDDLWQSFSTKTHFIFFEPLLELHANECKQAVVINVIQFSFQKSMITGLPEWKRPVSVWSKSTIFLDLKELIYAIRKS